MEERLERSLQVCLVLSDDLPEPALLKLIKRYYVFRCDLEDGKCNAVLLGHFRPDADMSRSGDDLRRLGAVRHFPAEIGERYTLSPCEGWLLGLELTDEQIAQLSTIFQIVAVEKGGQTRHVMRIVWHPIVLE